MANTAPLSGPSKKITRKKIARKIVRPKAPAQTSGILPGWPDIPVAGPVPTRPAQPTYTPPDESAIWAEAQNRTVGMLQPILDEINRRQQQETGQAQADKAAQVAAMTKAYQDQVAPLTQTYDTSVNQATQLNQSVADRLAASSGQDAAAYQKQLEAIGAPNAAQAGQQATQAGQAAGSVSYASGANDVSNLIAAKTADLAFLQKQPGVAAQQAEHDLASQLQEIVSKYQDQAGDVRSQIPQEVQSMFESAYGRKADASKSAFDAAAQSADNTYQDALNAWKAGNDQKQYTYEQKMAQRKELDDIAAQHEKNLYDLQQNREKAKLALLINSQNSRTKFNLAKYNAETKKMINDANNQYKQQTRQWSVDHGFTPGGGNLPQPKTTPPVKGQKVTTGGRILLIDPTTGATIKDLGPAPKTGNGRTPSNQRQVNKDATQRLDNIFYINVTNKGDAQTTQSKNVRGNIAGVSAADMQKAKKEGHLKNYYSYARQIVSAINRELSTAHVAPNSPAGIRLRRQYLNLIGVKTGPGGNPV